MTDFGHDGGVTSARFIGAIAGSAISLVYLLPRHRREAAVRFLTGLACGLIFGGPTGVWGAGRLGIEGRLSPAEIMLAGATLASFTAWWGLGVLVALLNADALLWLAPVALPLLLAIPLTVATSHVELGAWMRERGLLLIPEESWSPAVLRRAWRHASRLALKAA